MTRKKINIAKLYLLAAQENTRDEL